MARENAEFKLDEDGASLDEEGDSDAAIDPTPLEQGHSTRDPIMAATTNKLHEFSIADDSTSPSTPSPSKRSALDAKSSSPNASPEPRPSNVGAIHTNASECGDNDDGEAPPNPTDASTPIAPELSKREKRRAREAAKKARGAEPVTADSSDQVRQFVIDFRCPLIAHTSFDSSSFRNVMSAHRFLPVEQNSSSISSKVDMHLQRFLRARA